MPESTLAHQIFVGDGEMAQRMRSLDWRATAFGPLTEWPQSLRTAASICLASRFPMILWWGPTLSVLYNDAYIPIFQRKHPSVLGRTGVEAWGEVWDVIGPMFERVMTHGDATWSEDQMLELRRRGFREEAYFTWSYSPIRDESGGVGGVFTAVMETTERVLSARRLLTLRELSERAFQAMAVDEASRFAMSSLASNEADLPFALLYLFDHTSTSARLVSRVAIDGPAACPDVVGLADDKAPWPLSMVVRSCSAVTVDIPEQFGELRGRRWPEPVRRARLLPVSGGALERPVGAMVVGLSPRLEFDDSYRGFLDLVARHIAAAIGTAAAYQEERRRAEALAELDRAKTVFFSNVSHEFRTPLTLMLGPTEDALQSTDRALRGDDLEIVHRNEVRLLKLVNTLLDFSRLEAGRTDARFERTDLGALTTDVSSAFRAAAERAGLHLTIDVHDVPADVWVDHDMWEKVVLNLISNALKHTFNGGITIGVNGVPDGVALTVRDSGVGIAPEHLPHIFERFHRVPGSRARTHEGTGIGLSLVYELVRLHGGQVTVESAVDVGTTFHVVLPTGSHHLPQDGLNRERTPTATAAGVNAFVDEALRWTSAASGKPQSDTATGPGIDRPFSVPAGGTVLVADDNSDMRDYVARLLRPHFNVETAVDGVDALHRVHERPFDLVLSDVMMPRLDGFGLLKAIRSDPDTAHIRVVLLSARAGEESRIDGLEAGADDYLTKPFSARELVGTVRANVGLAALRREFEARERSLEHKAATATAQLDEILSAVGEGFVALDRDSRYAYVNDAAERILERRRADLLGRSPSDVFPSSALGELMQGLQRAVATSSVVRFELYVTDWDRWLEHRVYPSANGLSVFFFDITERKHAEAALRQREESQRLLVSLHDAVRSLRDPEQMMWECVTRVGQYLGASRCTYADIDAAEAVFPVRRDYTQGTSSIAGSHRLADFGPPLIDELKAGRTLVIEDVLADPRIEPAVTGAALASIDARSSVSVPLIMDGKFVAVLAVHDRAARRWRPADIALLEQVAERMWFAIENARAEAALREYRDVLALAMRGGRMGAWSRNLATNAVWWSRELEELFGLSAGGFEGTEDGFIAFIHPDDRAPVAAAVADAIQSHGDYVVEFRFAYTNGEWRWMDGRGRAVYSAEGHPLMLYGLGIDITERKQAEQALAIARDTAEAANQVKDQFLATLSHELRTPLNAILGYARMLRTNAIPTSKRGRAIEIIERNAVAQNQLVEDLLDISRITTGKVRLNTEALPLARPLQEAVESVKPAAAAKRIALELDIDPFAGTVNADATRLQQVFWNLLSNAVKFTEEGGRVRITLEQGDGALKATVRDSGIGIAPEFLPHVFDLFRQADGRFSRQHGGLGLGLAICKQLVELHGGTISAASNGPGCGATFTVLLPRHAPAAEDVTRDAAGDDARQPASLQGLDVLVVDDEEDALELFRQVLENAGAVVRTVRTGREALEEFDRHPPELLVTDLGLPGMDGYDLVRQVRTRPSARGGVVPAVAVTAYARMDDRAKSVAAGFNGHLSKPIDPETLISSLLAAAKLPA